MWHSKQNPQDRSAAYKVVHRKRQAQDFCFCHRAVRTAYLLHVYGEGHRQVPSESDSWHDQAAEIEWKRPCLPYQYKREETIIDVALSDIEI
jgi:hypothetical protein